MAKVVGTDPTIMVLETIVFPVTPHQYTIFYLYLYYKILYLNKLKDGHLHEKL